VTVLWEPSLPL